jgi:hypothetical protein
MSLTFAIAALLTAAGTIWQMVTSVRESVTRMSGILADYNALAQRESKSILSTIPWWNIVERRRGLKLMKRELPQVLSASELQLSSAYARAAIGWAFLSAGAVTAAYVAVLSFLTGG